MTAQKIFKADVRTDLTDILFEHRNKAYGAYILRKHYDERVNKSMLITMSIFLLFFLLAMIFTSHQVPNLALPKVPGPVVNFGKKLKLPPANTTQKKTNTLLPKTTAPKPAPDKNNFKLVKQLPPPVLKPDSNKTDQPKINTPAADGPSIPGLIPATPSLPPGSDGTPTAAPTKPVFNPDVMPRFPGGEGALDNYLKKHIQVPPIALDAEGKVYISFVIDADGTVHDVKLLKDKMGYGCAQNAMEAIKNMPLWTPGSTNGHVVPVEMMLPIDFQKEQE